MTGKKAGNLLLFISLFFHQNGQAQIKDSLKTGYLPDAAEEYWPVSKPGEKKEFSRIINHIPIRNGKGFISTGGYFREGYDRFDNYLRGRGPQDMVKQNC
ncbi:MAG TPA: hypothetical protein VKB95_12190 [Chitinophagaceae bacterium]|nr:hypothetical protein [Chitinophagaceae bacterium]